MEVVEAHQFTPLYDPREDRIRFIININTPQRYDMWLTRAMLIKILDHVEDFVGEESSVPVNESEESNKSEEGKIFAPSNKEIALLEQFSLTKKDNGFVVRISDGKREFVSFLYPWQLQQLLRLLKNQVRFVWGIV